jgi:hypothetical protein
MRMFRWVGAFCVPKNKYEILAKVIGVEKDRLRDLLLAAGCMKITQQRYYEFLQKKFGQVTGLIIGSNTYDGFNYTRMADATKQGRLHELQVQNFHGILSNSKKKNGICKISFYFRSCLHTRIADQSIDVNILYSIHFTHVYISSLEEGFHGDVANLVKRLFLAHPYRLFSGKLWLLLLLSAPT